MSMKDEIREIEDAVYSIKDKIPDGIYNVMTYSGEEMRAEKHNGIWYWVDGTRWSEQVEYPEEIISVVKVLAGVLIGDKP